MSALTLAGCGGAEPAGGAAPCIEVAPAEHSRLPADVPLAEWGDVTKVERTRGFTTAEAIGTRKIVEIYPDIVRRLGAEGYEFVGGDNEGFEAELAFVAPQERNVFFVLRNAGCEQVVIRVSVEDP